MGTVILANCLGEIIMGKRSINCCNVRVLSPFAISKDIFPFLKLFFFSFQSARRGDPHTHVIENVDLDHEGLYTCVVGNGELIKSSIYVLQFRF